MQIKGRLFAYQLTGEDRRFYGIKNPTQLYGGVLFGLIQI